MDPNTTTTNIGSLQVIGTPYIHSHWGEGNESQWITMDPNGSQWIQMDPNGS